MARAARVENHAAEDAPASGASAVSGRSILDRGFEGPRLALEVHRAALAGEAKRERLAVGLSERQCAARTGVSRVRWIAGESGAAPIDAAALELASPQIAAAFYRGRLDALEAQAVVSRAPLEHQAVAAVVAAVQLLALLERGGLEAAPRETLEQWLVLVRRAGERLRSLERAIVARLAELRKP